MPIPVLVPSGKLSITDSVNTRAEAFLNALIRVIREGTEGGTPGTTPTTPPRRYQKPGSDPPELIVPPLETADDQLFYRHLALVVCQSIGLASSTEFGVVRLSTDPGSPDYPTALNAEEVSVTPSPNKIPRAYGSGLIDSGWIGGGGGTPIPDGIFSAICQPSDAVGDLVRITSSSLHVTKVDPTDNNQMPVIGCIISKSSSTNCSVQSASLVKNVYSGLTPGRLLFTGTNGRPTIVRPSPSTGNYILVQPIGFSVDTNLILMSPSTTITRLRG